MKRIATIAFALGVAGAIGCAKKDTAHPDDVDATACTEEAKLCPDGSSVGREGPDCEFAACPGEEAEGGDAIEAGAEAGEPAEDAEPTDEAEAPEADAKAEGEA